MSNLSATLLFQLVGAVAAVVLLFVAWRIKQAGRWPKVPGQVVNAQVVTDADSKTRSQIEYRFTVGDRQYTGSRVYPLDHLSTHGSAAERTIARYPEGAEVAVFYNPERPEQCVLERRVPGWVLVAIACGALASFLLPQAFA